MPKDALADTVVDLDRLVRAVDSHEALSVTYLRQLRDELESTLRTIKALHAEQTSLTARRQEVTQLLRITKAKGKDLAVKLRSALKAHFGHRFEGLVQFQIRPVRRRTRSISEEAGIANLASLMAAHEPGASPARSAAPAEPSSASPNSPPAIPETGADSPEQS
jgi:hypothetical protein